MAALKKETQLAKSKKEGKDSKKGGKGKGVAEENEGEKK